MGVQSFHTTQEVDVRKQAQRKQSDRTALRERMRARRDAKRTHRAEKQQAQATEFRHRDEHTGGYGDPTP